jgi:3D (Asp-Asp-Asp) domain-containing protein
MKHLISSIIIAGQLATGRPNKTIQNDVQINQKLQQNKTIGIKKKHNIKQASNFKVNGVKMQVGATAYYGDTITSTGVKPIVGRTIAVDPKIIPYGTKVYIPELDKVFIAEDCGSAIKGNRIDIYMDSFDECMKWGYKTITIIILKD